MDDAKVEFGQIVDATDCDVVEHSTAIDAAGARVAFSTDPDGYAVELIEDIG